MKITKRQLTRLLREASKPAKPFSKEEAHLALNTIAAGPNAGIPFGQLVGEALQAGDFKKAASSAMDALFIDDVWPEQEEELAQMLSELGAGSSPDDVAQVMSDWMTDYRANPGGKPDHPSHPSWDKRR